MGEEMIFNKINSILAKANCNIRIKSLPELREFINNKDNQKLAVYDQIEELHSVLMLGPGMW